MFCQYDINIIIIIVNEWSNVSLTTFAVTSATGLHELVLLSVKSSACDAVKSCNQATQLGGAAHL